MSRPEEPREYAPNNKPYRGTLITSLRQSCGLGVKDLADAIGRHPASVSKIETNRANTSIVTLAAIADKLDVSMEDLLQAPLHPRLLRQPKGSNRLAVENSFLFGAEVDQLLSELSAEPKKLKVAGQLIVKITRSIVQSIKELE